MHRSLRFWLFGVLAVIVLVFYTLTDPDGWRSTFERILHVAWIIVLCGPVYLVRRAFMPEARGREAIRKALDHPIGAGLVALALALLTSILFLVFAGRSSYASELPPRALQYLPVLDREISSAWPAAPLRSVFGSMVEQETCPSLKSAKCWNPRAELKTSREYGFGLLQLTIAYRADGSERFNAWREVRELDRELERWQWADRYDARLQLRSLVVLTRNCYKRMRERALDDFNALAFCDAAHNGGMGGMLSDRRLCAAVRDCDPRRWFGHVERHSNKSRAKWKGYGESAFGINRTHVRNVMHVRRPRYVAWWGET